MINPPVIMRCKDSTFNLDEDVYVYDFMHNYDSFALCWVVSKKCWLSINVAALTPKIPNKKILNEEITIDE